MPELWIHLAVPFGLWALLYLAEWRSVRVGVRRAEIVRDRKRIRQLEAIEMEHVRIAGRVVSPDGGPVDLGTSVERPDSISGNPSLEGNPFILETAEGERFRIREGQFQIAGLPGAERKLVRTVTTADGVEQTYSFEVPDGFELHVIGKCADRAVGAFREGAIDLLPAKGSTYRIAERLADPRQTPKLGDVETEKNVSLVAFFFAAIAIGIGFVPYLGALIWFPAMFILALGVMGMTFGTTSAEPLSAAERTKLDALRARVRVEEVEEEAVEEEAGASTREREELEA